ncbi:MAG: hypothetical protein IRZ09_07865 [Variibacter sp.]|nr:hypothetical protein [Variibacter sp.]
MPDKFNLDEKFARFTEHWRPKVVAALNGQEIKLVKVQGTFLEHRTAADAEAEILIFEPAATRNTGNIADETFTAPNGVTV